MDPALGSAHLSRRASQRRCRRKDPLVARIACRWAASVFQRGVRTCCLSILTRLRKCGCTRRCSESERRECAAASCLLCYVDSTRGIPLGGLPHVSDKLDTNETQAPLSSRGAELDPASGPSHLFLAQDLSTFSRTGNEHDVAPSCNTAAHICHCTAITAELAFGKTLLFAMRAR